MALEAKRKAEEDQFDKELEEEHAKQLNELWTGRLRAKADQTEYEAWTKLPAKEKLFRILPEKLDEIELESSLITFFHEHELTRQQADSKTTSCSIDPCFEYIWNFGYDRQFIPEGTPVYLCRECENFVVCEKCTKASVFIAQNHNRED